MNKNFLFSIKVIVLAVLLLPALIAYFSFSSVRESSSATLKAFPTAEGAGQFATHGRGGSVIEVTTLADAKPAPAGSLRAALEASGKRIVVFRIGGWIDLVDDITIKNPDIYIAGQTAPGDGIAIRNFGLVLRASNIVIRFLRVRTDPYIKLPKESCYNFNMESGGPFSDVVLDHNSISWGSDDVLPINNFKNVTVQWNLIGENFSSTEPGTDPEPQTGRGTWLGPEATNISIHHNLYVDNAIRNPYIKGGATADVVNNVMYNWMWSATQLESDEREIYKNSAAFVNIVNNYYKKGKNSACDEIWVNDIKGDLPISTNTRLYVEGNYGPSRPKGTEDDWKSTVCRNGGTGNGNGTDANPVLKATERLNSGIPVVTTTTAAQAYTDVVYGDVGATKPKRDATDTRLVNYVKNNTGFIRGNFDDYGGWPEYKSGTVPEDNDHDGMPDSWEKSKGLDPNNASDRNNYAPSGYTWVEQYLSELAGDF